MIPELEKLWELADVQLEQSEAAKEDTEETERSWYYEGFADALRWLMDVLEEELDAEHENSDEW